MNSSLIWHPLQQKRFCEQVLPVDRAEGAYLILKDGRSILDMVCSWWVTLHGHGEPSIAKAIYEQALRCDQVLFANFSHDAAQTLSQELAHFLPDHLTKFFFSDNGSTSVEIALKMAYQYWQNKGETQRKSFLCFDGAYHGDTLGAMSVGAPSPFTKPFEDLLFPVDRIPFPATWEGDTQVEEKERESLQQAKILLQTGSYAALIIEPLIQGSGGMKMCRPNFLQALDTICKQSGTLLIYDEVFVGFGRTGHPFVCSSTKTKADLLCLSKGITGGFLPLSLTLATEEIYQAFQDEDPKKGFFHAHSYTANPLGCAAGIASLKLFKKQAYTKIEAWHRKYSKKLRSVSHLRFCGTVAAFEVHGKNDYLNPISVRIRQACLKKNLFLRPLGNTVYLMPPYCIKEEEIDFSYSVLAEVLEELGLDAPESSSS